MHLLPTGYFCFCQLPYIASIYGLLGILVCVTPLIEQASTAYWVFHVYVNPLTDQASTACWVFNVHVNPLMDQASTACWASARLYIHLFSNRLGVERNAGKSSAAHWRV